MTHCQAAKAEGTTGIAMLEGLNHGLGAGALDHWFRARTVFHVLKNFSFLILESDRTLVIPLLANATPVRPRLSLDFVPIGEVVLTLIHPKPQSSLVEELDGV
jgi:hypothetical protein